MLYSAAVGCQSSRWFWQFLLICFFFFFGVQSKQKPPVEKVGGSLPIAPYILGFLFLAVGCLSRFCPVFRATPCALIQWLITPDDMPRVPVWCQQLLTVELNLEQRSSHVPCQILRGPYRSLFIALSSDFLRETGTSILLRVRSK